MLANHPAIRSFSETLHEERAVRRSLVNGSKIHAFVKSLSVLLWKPLERAMKASSSVVDLSLQPQLSTFKNPWYTGGTLLVHWWVGSAEGKGDAGRGWGGKLPKSLS